MLVLKLVWLPNGSEPKGSTGLLSCKKCGNCWKQPREGVWAISHKWIAQLKQGTWALREFVEMDEFEEMCRGMQESTWPTVRTIRSSRHTLSWSHGTLSTLASSPRTARCGWLFKSRSADFSETERAFFLSALKSQLFFVSTVRLEMLI